MIAMFVFVVPNWTSIRHTQGTITAATNNGVAKYNYEHPEVEFIVNGQQYKRFAYETTNEGLSVGDVITIHYDSRDPENAVYPDVARSQFLLLSLFIVALVIGLFIFRTSFKGYYNDFIKVHLKASIFTIGSIAFPALLYLLLKSKVIGVANTADFGFMTLFFGMYCSLILANIVVWIKSIFQK